VDPDPADPGTLWPGRINCTGTGSKSDFCKFFFQMNSSAFDYIPHIPYFLKSLKIALKNLASVPLCILKILSITGIQLAWLKGMVWSGFGSKLT
jgi:hypothetical protein